MDVEKHLTDAGTRLTLSTLVRHVIREIAPEELEILPQLEQAWAKGGPGIKRGRRWTGGSVGFGLDPMLVSQTVLGVLVGAFSEVLGEVAVGGWRRWRRGRRPPSRRERLDTLLPPLSTAQTQQFRDACRRHAAAAGSSDERAELIADAAYGVLLQQIMLGPSAADASIDPGGSDAAASAPRTP